MADETFKTLSEYAEHRKISRPRVSQLKPRLKEAGCLTQTGRIRVEKADAFLNSSLNDAKRRKSAAKTGTLPDGMTESRARILNLAVKTERETISLKKEKGQLLDAEEVKMAAFTTARSIRDGMLTIPERISDQLAVMDNALEIRLLLRKEIRQALQDECEKLGKSQ